MTRQTLPDNGEYNSLRRKKTTSKMKKLRNHPQSNQQENSPKTANNETDLCSLTDLEFKREIVKTLKELRAYTRKILGFLFFGAIVLVLSYFLEDRFQRVFYDSVNIIGGFSIWEAADLFFFARTEKRKELISIVKLLEAEWIQRDIS